MTAGRASEPTIATAGRHLEGNLGATAVTFMVIAAAAPLTVVGGIVPNGLLIGNGLGFPVAFIGAALILLLFSSGLTALSRYLPVAGSFFTFITHGLGRTPGVIAAYLALVTYTTVQLAVLAYLGGTLRSDIEQIGGPSIPWWILTLLGVLAVGILGYRHIELSSKVLFVLLACEMGIVVVLGIVILAKGGAGGVTFGSFQPHNIFSGSPALGLMFAIASFIGFESTVVYRNEAREPNRTVPKATYGSALAIGLFYAFAAWVMVVGVGENKVVGFASSDPATMLQRITREYLGQAGEVVTAVLFLGSMFACVLSLHNVLTRYHHSMANARLFPNKLGQVHRTHGSPHAASITQVVTAAVLSVFLLAIGFDWTNIFAWFAGIGTLSIVILQALTCLSVIVYFQRNKVLKNPWHTLIAPGLGFVGLVYAGYLIAKNFPLLVGDVDAAGNPTWGKVSLWLVAVVVIGALVGLIQALIVRATKPRLYEEVRAKFDEMEAVQ